MNNFFSIWESSCCTYGGINSRQVAAAFPPFGPFHPSHEGDLLLIPGLVSRIHGPLISTSVFPFLIFDAKKLCRGWHMSAPKMLAETRIVSLLLQISSKILQVLEEPFTHNWWISELRWTCGQLLRDVGCHPEPLVAELTVKLTWRVASVPRTEDGKPPGKRPSSLTWSHGWGHHTCGHPACHLRTEGAGGSSKWRLARRTSPQSSWWCFERISVV